MVSQTAEVDSSEVVAQLMVVANTSVAVADIPAVVAAVAAHQIAPPSNNPS